jgi:uncharacterized protein
MPSRPFRVGRSATGLGLFATKPIKRAAYIATYRGRRISTEEADRRLARGASYIFELNGRWSIDGSPRRNVARYINHSCRPNAKPVHRNGGIVIVALHRIEPGEEITYDYGREYLNYFLDNGGCRCAACRKAARRRKSKTSVRKVNMTISRRCRVRLTKCSNPPSRKKTRCRVHGAGRRSVGGLK